MPPPEKPEGYETLPADPVIQLDDISVRLKKLTGVMEKQQEIMLQILNTNLSNQQSNAAIRKLLQDMIDEGEYKYISGTATTTETLLNIIKDFNFPVNGYIFKNDGSNTIKFSHVSYKIASPDDIPVESFGDVLAGEELKIISKTKKIRMIKIKTASGSSDYRLWLLW